MTITVYADVILPNRIISAGARGKQVRNNNRTLASNGTQQVNVNWARTLRQYELGVVPLSVADWQTLEGLFEVTEGGAFGFLMQDPKDTKTLITEGVATAKTSTTFQLWKTYTSAGSTRTKLRKITRPIAAGFDIKVSGVSLTVTSQYTLNTVTGVVTIASAPATGNITWSGSFYVPVHFSSDEIDWELVRSGPADTRLMAGPSVTVLEVAE
jgi:uncharacterized protein (TIGR02217 family)